MNGFTKFAVATAVLAATFTPEVIAKEYEVINGDEFYVSGGVTRLIISSNSSGKKEESWGPHILVGKYITKNISAELRYFKNTSDEAVGSSEPGTYNIGSGLLKDQLSANLRYSYQSNEVFAPYVSLGVTTNSMDYMTGNLLNSERKYESKKDSGIFGAVGFDFTVKHGVINVELGINEVDSSYQAKNVSLGYKYLF